MSLLPVEAKHNLIVYCRFSYIKRLKPDYSTINFLNRHEQEKHQGLLVPDAPPDDERDSEGYYRCRAGCGLVYKIKATRNRLLSDDIALVIPFYKPKHRNLLTKKAAKPYPLGQHIAI